MANQSGSTVYAGFWARVAAYMVDVAIMFIIGLALGLALPITHKYLNLNPAA